MNGYGTPPQTCPVCGSDDIYREQDIFDDGAFYVSMCCAVCDAEWEELYMFAGYRVDRRGATDVG